LAKLPLDYAALFAAATDALSSELGLIPSADFNYTPFEEAGSMLHGSSIAAQRLTAISEYIAEHGLEELHPVTREIFSESSAFDAVTAYKDIFTLQLYRRQAELQFRDHVDVVVVPSTIAHPAIADGDEDGDTAGLDELLGTFTHFVNLLDLCALAVPAGVWKNTNGAVMPFGVTFVGQAGRDEELLELGRKLMDVI
jgi:allophanate hydrolase